MILDNAIPASGPEQSTSSRTDRDSVEKGTGSYGTSASARKRILDSYLWTRHQLAAPGYASAADAAFSLYGEAIGVLVAIVAYPIAPEARLLPRDVPVDPVGVPGAVILAGHGHPSVVRETQRYEKLLVRLSSDPNADVRDLRSSFTEWYLAQ